MQHWGQWGSPKWLGSGAKGTRGARLSPAVLLQDVCSNTWLRSRASLLKDQSHYCPCAALVVQNGLFFLIIFFSNIGNCQMLQEGETQPACEPWSCCHAHPGLSRSSLLCSALPRPHGAGCRVSPSYRDRGMGTKRGSARLREGSERFLCLIHVPCLGMQGFGQELGGIEREKVPVPRHSTWGFIGAEAGDFGAALGYREAAAPQPICVLGLSPSSRHL